MEKIITAKLEELAKQKEQIIANLNAVIGAEQALRDLLAKINQEDDDA